MNWIKQEHFTASASLHGVIIPSLPLVCEISLLFLCYYPPTYVSVVKATLSNDEPHLSCICGLLSCSVDENAPKLCFVCAPQKNHMQQGNYFVVCIFMDWLLFTLL